MTSYNRVAHFFLRTTAAVCRFRFLIKRYVLFLARIDAAQHYSKLSGLSILMDCRIYAYYGVYALTLTN